MSRTDELWTNGIDQTYIKTSSPEGYNVLINGTNKYLNFNTLSGSAGYGFRDNAGSIEFKNSGGAWTAVGSGGGGGTPGGSTTQLQYNNAGSFGGISGATTNGTSVTYTTGNLLGADIKASSSAGLQILSSAGTVTALFGAGGGANSTFYGGSKFDYATASTVPYFDASKNLISSAVTPTELGYLSGVTSAIQTQLNGKASATAYTLAGVSAISTDATKSLYTMTSTIPVEFRRSGGSTLLYLDETNGRVGVKTNSPTHRLTFGYGTGVATDGFAVYSTADQTTNYQRAVFYNTSANLGTFDMQKGGTGTTGYWRWQVNSASVFEVDSAQAVLYGNLLVGPDNTKTLGRLSGSPLRFRSMYLGTSFQVGAAADTAIAATIHGVGAGITSSTSSLLIEKSDGTDMLKIRDDGVFSFNTTSTNYPYNFGGPSGSAFVGFVPSSMASGDIGFYFAGPVVVGNTSPMLFRQSASTGLNISFENQNSAASTADVQFNMSVNGASAGDPYTVYTVTGVTNWSSGIDNSDSDKLKIGPYANPSTGALGITMTTSGDVGIGTASPISTLTIQGGNTIDALAVRLTGETPFLASFYNSAYSSSNPVFRYFGYNSGEFRMGNPNTQGVGIYTGSGGYATPGIYLRSNNDVGIGGSAGGSGTAFNTPTLVALASGIVGIGTTFPDRLLHEEVSDSGTNAVVYGQRHSHITSGAATTGFGIGEEYELENASGTNRVAATQEFSWSDATNATEDTKYTLNLMRGGTLTEAFNVSSVGLLTANRLAGSQVSTTYATMGADYGSYGGVYLTNTSVVQWFNGAINTTIDTMISRTSAGNLSIDNGTSGSALGTLALSKLVEANTAGSGSPNILTASESNKVLTNEGASALNYHTLPTAVAGLTYTFIVQDADGIRITANTGDTIRIAGVVSSSAGYAESTVIGSTVTLVAINATEWLAVSSIGTWSLA